MRFGLSVKIKGLLTSPSSPGAVEVTARSLPLESNALISMPQLVSGCRSHTLNTCLTSMLCQELTPAFTSIFRERMRMCRPPSVIGMRREICRKTVVASAAERRCTQSCARTMRLAWNFGVGEKKQHLGCPSTCTAATAGHTGSAHSDLTIIRLQYTFLFFNRPGVLNTQLTALKMLNKVLKKVTSSCPRAVCPQETYQ